MIGSSCQIYKKCWVCGQTKWYKEFESNGKRKRKSYCRKCKDMKSESFGFKNSPYKFDTQILKRGDIKVRVKLRFNKKIEYTVSYEEAVLLVNEGMAGIVHETLIHKLYEKQAFKELILERDNNICCYCGKFGDTIDHIKSKSEGGITSFNNCICACKKCNGNKGSLALEEFLFYIEPIKVRNNIQDGRIEEQLKYLAHSLECLSTQILNKRFFEEQSLDRTYQTIEQIEKRVAKIKTNILTNSKHSIT